MVATPIISVKLCLCVWSCGIEKEVWLSIRPLLLTGCGSHTHYLDSSPCLFSPPEKSVIVTSEEREVFVEVCQRIEEVVTYQLQNFRTCFPFCSPKGDLRTTLKLFDLVCV